MKYLPKKTRRKPKCRVDSERPGRQAMDVPQRDLKRLADAVTNARELLGVTQEEFAKLSGLSLTTVQRVEACKVQPRAKTFKGLDTGAQWEPGSARLVYEEGRPPVSSGDEGTPEEKPLTETEEKIIAMTHRELAERYIELADVSGRQVADEWLFKAVQLRLKAGHTLATEQR